MEYIYIPTFYVPDPDDTFTPTTPIVVIEEDADSPQSPSVAYNAGLLNEQERDRLTDYQGWGIA